MPLSRNAIIPTNTVSDEAGMANGWIRGVGTRTNLSKLAYPNGTNPVKTCVWDGGSDSVAAISLKTVDDPHGHFLGTLDGRGSAMLNVELGFDGTRVYVNYDESKVDGIRVPTLGWTLSEPHIHTQS